MSSLTSIQIQALVRGMDESMRRHKGLKRTNHHEYLKMVAEENQRLYDEFPSIYEMHIDGKLDEKFFNMLKLRRQIEKGEISEDDASKLVGQMLFDQYVAPIVSNTPVPSQMTYEQYYQQNAQAGQLEAPESSSHEKTE
jgi:uncharacterized short protein YbdD (DUF466 family)